MAIVQMWLRFCEIVCGRTLWPICSASHHPSILFSFPCFFSSSLLWLVVSSCCGWSRFARAARTTERERETSGSVLVSDTVRSVMGCGHPIRRRFAIAHARARHEQNPHVTAGSSVEKVRFSGVRTCRHLVFALGHESSDDVSLSVCASIREEENDFFFLSVRLSLICSFGDVGGREVGRKSTKEKRRMDAHTHRQQRERDTNEASGERFVHPGYFSPVCVWWRFVVIVFFFVVVVSS